MIITFDDIVRKHALSNKASSNIKIQQILSSFGLNNVGIFSRDGPFSSDIRIVTLHPSIGTHWVCILHEKYFDSYACSPPQKLYKFITKRNKHCLYSEYKTQGLTNKRDSYCDS